MLRRWYIVIICLALTAGGAFAMSRTIQATYQSTATVILLPPPSVVTEEGNPYLFMGGLDQALSVLAVKLNSAEVAQSLVGVGESYTVEKDARGPGPLVSITAEATTGPGSAELRDAILDRLPQDLRDMQDDLGVASDSQIGALTVVQSDEPTKMMKEQLRALLGMAAVGVGMTVWVTGLFDRWLLARAERHRKKPEPADSETAESVPPMVPAAAEETKEDWDAAYPDLLEGRKASAGFISSGNP